MAKIVNVKFKDGVTCSIFKHEVTKALLGDKHKGSTYGTRRIGICPETGLLVLQEFNGISNGQEEWLCMHNTIREDDAVDIAAFKKRYNIQQDDNN